MASSAPSAPYSSVLILFAIVVLMLARRTYLSITGARYSAGRLFGFSGFYLLIFGALGATTIYLALASWGSDTWLLVAPYAGVVVGAAALAVPHVRQTVQFEQRSPGRWYYRLPWVVPVAYLVLFVLRFAVEAIVFGFASATSFVLPTSEPVGTLLLLVTLDLLFGVSMGLLVGRAVGVYRAFHAPSGPARTARPLPDPPP